jgi:hypothetical protein
VLSESVNKGLHSPTRVRGGIEEFDNYLTCQGFLRMHLSLSRS